MFLYVHVHAQMNMLIHCTIHCTIVSLCVTLYCCIYYHFSSITNEGIKSKDLSGNSKYTRLENEVRVESHVSHMTFV